MLLPVHCLTSIPSCSSLTCHSPFSSSLFPLLLSGKTYLRVSQRKRLEVLPCRKQDWRDDIIPLSLRKTTLWLLALWAFILVASGHWAKGQGVQLQPETCRASGNASNGLSAAACTPLVQNSGLQKLRALEAGPETRHATELPTASDCLITHSFVLTSTSSPCVF